MKKIYITLSVAVALVLAGGAYEKVSAQYYYATCPQGEICGWIDVTNVRDYGVIPTTRNGVGFTYDAETQDQLCRIKGYDHSLSGYNITRKWSKCNNENHVTWKGYWSQYGCQSRTYLTNVYCTKFAPNANPTISWSKAPASATCDASYTVEAAGADSDGNLSAVSVDKEGTPFAYNGGGNGYNEVSGNPTSDSGPKTVTFTAWANDDKGGVSEVITHTVNIGACVAPNREPQGSFSANCSWFSGNAYDPDSPGQSIGVHFYVDGPAGSGSFVGAVNTEGSSKGYSMGVPESLRTNTNRTLYAYGIDTQGGNNPQIGTATINCAPTPIPQPSGVIAVSPTKFSSSSGGNVTISWSVSDAGSCTASGDWSGTKAPSGSETRNVNRSSTFALSCTGAGGTWTDSANTVVAGNLSIGHFSVSPSSVKGGDSFTISASTNWNGVDYLRRHRAYFQGSQGGLWTYAGGSYTTSLSTNGNYTAEKNPYSMYKGPGTYTIVYEAEDSAGHTVSDTRSFEYKGEDLQCSSATHTCSASYSDDYEYPKDRVQQSITVYQSCDISPADHSALNIPGGTATLINRAYSSECPQCWYDTHQYKTSTWHCDRTLSGYSHPYYKDTFSINYFTSCTISSAEKQALINAGYTYGYVQRTRDASPGEWTDVHYMSNCPVDYTPYVPTNNDPITCKDPAADNYQAQGSCSYSSVDNDPSGDPTGGGTGDTGGNGGGPGGTGGPGGSQSTPDFTVTSDTPTAQIQFLGTTGAVSATRMIEVSPVSGFQENVTLSVKSVRVKGSTVGLPEGLVTLYSFDGKNFSPDSSVVQQFNSSIGGGRYLGDLGVGSTFRVSFSKAVNVPYEVIIQGVSQSGKTAEYALTIDPTATNPSFQEI